ncbi:hypothetical protein [Pedobacter sp. SYSU D00535]|uniref:ACP phosphodiesterase n=1 Tax=Pedobacter sp. SYSU D00535 TaxID=2810308 RepID=UPI001A967535|nr:hypothetical protein [Pedobacter sp. SYSU D00535]
MNFLSHYYFDRFTTDPDRVIGMVLPDLVKNASKDWCLRPEKQEEKFKENDHLRSLLIGWKRHLEVDKIFHSSDFFCRHTENIKLQIVPVLSNSLVRPSFVAHIALELMLDALLLTESVLEAESFYEQIAAADQLALNQFLKINQVEQTDRFFRFLDEFIEASYLNSYREANNIMYALTRICMRLWSDPFSETQKLQLTSVLIDYQRRLKDEFMEIFNEIDRRIN